LELDPKKDPETDSELDPNSWQSGLQIAQSALQIAQSALRIAKSAVAFATGLPQCHNKLRNCQAYGIPLSNFYFWV
jgi:hypothetical protein